MIQRQPLDRAAAGVLMAAAPEEIRDFIHVDLSLGTEIHPDLAARSEVLAE